MLLNHVFKFPVKAMLGFLVLAFIAALIFDKFNDVATDNSKDSLIAQQDPSPLKDTDDDIAINKPKESLIAPQNSTVVYASFIDWQEHFKRRALQEGVKQETLDRAFKNITLNETVIRLDANQPEFTRPIWEYLDNAISQQRINKGKKTLEKYKPLLDEVTEKYHVPAALIIAIWAMESDFGGNYGSMSVIRSLATLAYAGKRKTFAQDELLAVLHILEEEKLEVSEVVGSWAGAMGHPQFMPRSFLNYAVDYDNDGKRDLWHSIEDALASIAHYMQVSGWNNNESWGVEVTVPEDFNWQAQAKKSLDSDGLLTIKNWSSLGLEPAAKTSFSNEDTLARLLFPAGHLGPAFLTFENFEVIKKYNFSLSYSLAVGLLLSDIADDTTLLGAWPRDDKPLSRTDKVLLQIALNEQGFDAGKVDGKIGANTRKAIKAWQLKNNRVADGYMTQILLEQLR